MKNFINKFKDKSQGFILWSVEFSKRLIIMLSVLFIIFLIYSMIIPFFGVATSDTLIEEFCGIFKITVCAYLIKSVIENVFRYNKFSFSQPNGEYEYDETDEYNETNDDETTDDEVIENE